MAPELGTTAGKRACSKLIKEIATLKPLGPVVKVHVLSRSDSSQVAGRLGFDVTITSFSGIPRADSEQYGTRIRRNALLWFQNIGEQPPSHSSMKKRYILVFIV